MTLPHRSRWPTLLAAAPHAAVIASANAIMQSYPATHLTLPRTGLRLLKMKESVFGETYYLGEVPVAAACVSLTAPGHAKAEGAAEILGDNENLAVAIAVIDAALSAHLPGCASAEALIREGAAIIDARDAMRGDMLNRTKVDFSLMSEASTTREGDDGL